MKKSKKIGNLAIFLLALTIATVSYLWKKVDFSNANDEFVKLIEKEYSPEDIENYFPRSKFALTAHKNMLYNVLLEEHCVAEGNIGCASLVFLKYNKAYSFSLHFDEAVEHTFNVNGFNFKLITRMSEEFGSGFFHQKANITDLGFNKPADIIVNLFSVEDAIENNQVVLSTCFTDIENVDGKVSSAKLNISLFRAHSIRPGSCFSNFLSKLSNFTPILYLLKVDSIQQAEFNTLFIGYFYKYIDGLNENPTSVKELVKLVTQYTQDLYEKLEESDENGQ